MYIIKYHWMKVNKKSFVNSQQHPFFFYWGFTVYEDNTFFYVF